MSETNASFYYIELPSVVCFGLWLSYGIRLFGTMKQKRSIYEGHHRPFGLLQAFAKRFALHSIPIFILFGAIFFIGAKLTSGTP